MLTIREFGDFHKDALKLLSQESYEDLVSHLAIHPDSGDVMAGTGGFRKLRWKRENMGKSGGVRVVYFYYVDDLPLSLVAIYSKNQKENLSQAEHNELKMLAALLKKGL